MISLQPFFKDADINSVPKKYKKRISRKCKIFKGFEASLPELSYPEIDTERFEADLNEVRRCVKDPSLTKKFLKLSDRSAEDVFKKFLKDEEVDWSSMSDIFKEFESIEIDTWRKRFIVLMFNISNVYILFLFIFVLNKKKTNSKMVL